MNTCYLDALAVSGYRSFGAELQHFYPLSQINIFIGQNNSGKSNVLRLVSMLESEDGRGRIKLDRIDEHVPGSPPFRFGVAVANDSRSVQQLIRLVKTDSPRTELAPAHLETIAEILGAKAQIDNSESAWFYFDYNRVLIRDGWKEAFDRISDSRLHDLWGALRGVSGGDRNQSWYPETLKTIAPTVGLENVVFIPAIRKVDTTERQDRDFSGKGIIDQLAKLENPTVHEQSDREIFRKINELLRDVTGNQSATINVPHDRETILVHMDGKVLPLESLGTGIHEMVILASAASSVTNAVVCMEEPELHLNPLLQKKLIRYLKKNTSNQYFISTHSASLMDTPSAEVFQIELGSNGSLATRVTSDNERSLVCELLGYKPSDLLQANCVIWVEGPSDRIYINYWIHFYAPRFIEGVHYSVMYYGGRLASHLTGLDLDIGLEDFISLKRLNRRGVIVIDSDRSYKGKRINSTKIRLKNEFDAGPGFCWVTAGREIENYIPESQIRMAVNSIHNSSLRAENIGPYDQALRLESEKIASKVKVSRWIAENTTPDFCILDLGARMRALIQFIDDSNKGVDLSAS